MKLAQPLVDAGPETMEILYQRINEDQLPTIESARKNNTIPRGFKVLSLATTGFSPEKDYILAWAGIHFPEDGKVTMEYRAINWYEKLDPEELAVFEERLHKTKEKLEKTMFFPYGKEHMDQFGEPAESFNQSLIAFLDLPEVLVGYNCRFDMNFISHLFQRDFESIHSGGVDSVLDMLHLTRAAFHGMKAPKPTDYAVFSAQMANGQGYKKCSLFPDADVTYQLLDRIVLTEQPISVHSEPLVQKANAIYALMRTWQAFVQTP